MSKSTLITLAAAFSLTTAAWAEAPNAYQVTGPVIELTETKIVVLKGKEKWEIGRNADAKVTGDLKVGSKVTVHYSMTAKAIEVKDDKAKK